MTGHGFRWFSIPRHVELAIPGACSGGVACAIRLQVHSQRCPCSAMSDRRDVVVSTAAIGISRFIAISRPRRANEDRRRLGADPSVSESELRYPTPCGSTLRVRYAPPVETEQVTMSKISAESGVQTLPDLALSTTGAAKIMRMPAHPRTKSGHGFEELKSTGAQGKQPAMDRPKMMRTPLTRERLHRLRHELGKISPSPSTIEQARAEIIKAMARANLAAWRVPGLTGESAIHYTDGSVQVSLIAHEIVFNSTGAFQIVDTHPPGMPYFEMCGRDGAAFASPCGMRAKAYRNVESPRDEAAERGSLERPRRA